MWPFCANLERWPLARVKLWSRRARPCQQPHRWGTCSLSEGFQLLGVLALALAGKGRVPVLLLRLPVSLSQDRSCSKSPALLHVQERHAVEDFSQKRCAESDWRTSLLSKHTRGGFEPSGGICLKFRDEITNAAAVLHRTVNLSWCLKRKRATVSTF